MLPHRSPNSPLGSPELHRSLTGYLLRRGVARDDVPDLVQAALVNALVATEQCPNAPASRQAPLAMKIARDLSVSYFRTARARGKFDGGSYDESDDTSTHVADCRASALDMIEHREDVAWVRDHIPPLSFAIMLAAIEDVPEVEIAREHGISVQTVRNHIWAVRRGLRDPWKRRCRGVDRPVHARGPGLSNARHRKQVTRDAPANVG